MNRRSFLQRLAGGVVATAALAFLLAGVVHQAPVLVQAQESTFRTSGNIAFSAWKPTPSRLVFQDVAFSVAAYPTVCLKDRCVSMEELLTFIQREGRDR